jgi:hypothetical protein
MRPQLQGFVGPQFYLDIPTLEGESAVSLKWWDIIIYSLQNARILSINVV